MPSNDAKIYKALIDQLKAYPDLPDVVEGGEAYDPNPKTPHLIVDDLRFDNVRPYVGQGRHLNRGALMIGVMCPKSWTYMQSLEYAGDVVDFFAAGVTMEYDGVKIRTDKNAQVINAAYMDETHYRVPIQCLWVGMV